MNAQTAEQTTDLVVIQTAITEYQPYAKDLAELKQRYEGVVYDVTTKQGMADAKAARKLFKDLRLALEAKRVEIKAPALERSRAIDADAKLIGNELLPLEKSFDDQIKAEEERIAREKAAIEEAARKRQEDLQAAFAKLQSLATFHVSEKTLDEIEDLIAEAECFDVQAHDEANRAGVRFQVQVTVNALKAKRDERLAWDTEQARVAAERAELEQLRAQQAQREAEEAERIRAANAEAERARIAEEERVKAERDAAIAIEQAEERAREAEQQAADRAERAAAEAREQAEREARERDEERLANERRQKAADAARAADIEHRRGINSKAVAALQKEGLTAEQAMLVIGAIAKNRIPAVSIHY